MMLMCARVCSDAVDEIVIIRTCRTNSVEKGVNVEAELVSPT